MKKIYQKPRIVSVDFKIEGGYTASVTPNFPGGDNRIVMGMDSQFDDICYSDIGNPSNNSGNRTLEGINEGGIHFF